MKLSKLLTTATLLLFAICNAQKNTDLKINTKVNKEFLETQQSLFGKLDSEDAKIIRAMITKELDAAIPDDRSIFINYFQYGTHCYEYGLSKKDSNSTVDRQIKISSSVTKDYNVADFFVYTNQYPKKENFEKRKNFILDSGFFQKTIFTIQDHCSAFFILKPNGDFIKHYGPDYHSQVLEFLKKESN